MRCGRGASRRSASRALASRLPSCEEVLRGLHTPRQPGLPPLTGGLVGYIGYDAVRRWERLPSIAADELRLPEIGLMLATDLAVLDHSDGTVLLIANAINYDATDDRVDEAWLDAVARLDAMTADLAVSTSATVAVVDEVVDRAYVSRTERSDFLAAVEQCEGGDLGGGCLPDRGQPAF